MAWMFIIPLVIRLARRGEPPQTTRELAVLGWSGMRGGVSLAAALALPLAAAGHGFPDRSTVIFIAYAAIATTLVIPGLTLSPLIRRLGLGAEETLAQEEARARVALAHAAIGRVEELAERDELPEQIADTARAAYEQRIHRLAPEVDHDADDGDEAAAARRLRQLRRELIGVERRRLGELRRRGELSADSMRRIERELDLEESRFS
jgi:CPA1 family monovalent cation:H+ antiporter